MLFLAILRELWLINKNWNYYVKTSVTNDRTITLIRKFRY